MKDLLRFLIPLVFACEGMVKSSNVICYFSAAAYEFLHSQRLLQFLPSQWSAESPIFDMDVWMLCNFTFWLDTHDRIAPEEYNFLNHFFENNLEYCGNLGGSPRNSAVLEFRNTLQPSNSSRWKKKYVKSLMRCYFSRKFSLFEDIAYGKYMITEQHKPCLHFGALEKVFSFPLVAPSWQCKSFV